MGTTPQPSYHSRPQPSYHTTPQPVFHSKSHKEYHTSYSTPHSYVKFGAIHPYSEPYSRRPSTSILFNPTPPPRSYPNQKKYTYSPTPLPNPSVRFSSPIPSYQRFSIGQPFHNLQSSY